jgi:hypothetical protein
MCANTPQDIWQALGQWLGSQQALQLAQHQSQTWMAQHQGASVRSCAAMTSFMGLATTPNDAAVYSHRARHTRVSYFSDAHPRAHALFFWPSLERQIRVLGSVHKISAEESSAYFTSRPLGSQWGAAASQQSQPIAAAFRLVRSALA